ncbi:MAG: hypothetical protein OXE96_07310 [Gemmatimonadetes bacterium]|nr:hypothetical protein [Gemmatimonadota bacterium]
MNVRTLALALALAAPTPGFAQEAEPPSGHKEPVIALAIELFVPVLGHAYAGDAKRGIAPAVVHVAGVGLVIHALNENLNNLFNSEKDSRNVAIVGLAAFAVGKAWGLVSVASTVGERNASLVVEPTPDRQVSVGIKVSF